MSGLVGGEGDRPACTSGARKRGKRREPPSECRVTVQPLPGREEANS
jgi:hypothetical protein